jgi:hypothetical protein
MPNGGNAFAGKHRQHLVGEAAEVRVHDVERHLYGVEVELVLARVVQHAQVDVRILVSSEADVAHLARFFGFEHGFHGAALGEDAVRVFEADDLVELHHINVIGLQALQRLVNLLRCGLLGAAVDFGHEKNLVAVAALERLPHADFADAVVIVPAVVHEGDAAVDGLADELDGIVLGDGGFADVIAAEADGGDALAGAAQRAINHAFCLRCLVRPRQGRKKLLRGGHANCRGCRFQKISSVHGSSRGGYSKSSDMDEAKMIVGPNGRVELASRVHYAGAFRRSRIQSCMGDEMRSTAARRNRGVAPAGTIAFSQWV